MEGGGDRRKSLLSGWGLKVEADGVRVVGAGGQVGGALSPGELRGAATV